MAGKPPRSPAILLEAQSSMKKNQKIIIKGDKKRKSIFFSVLLLRANAASLQGRTLRLWMAVCVQSRTAYVSFTSSSSVFQHSPKQKKKKNKKEKSFLSLMADSHKFVLNMSFIDPSCQMKTIKEMALSAAHLGAKMEGLK